MKTQELRGKISNLARQQLSTDQISQSLGELVGALDQLENDHQAEAALFHRRFSRLLASMATAATALSLTCCFLWWHNLQLREQLAQSQAQLARHQEQLTQQQARLSLHEDALIKILGRMTNQAPSQAGRS